MYKIDMHVHTAEVSPCSKVKAETHIREYKKIGYDGVVITDHFNHGIFEKLEGETWKEKVDSYLAGYKNAKKVGDEIGLDVYLGAEIKVPGNNNEYLVHGVEEKFFYENENIFLKPLSEVKKIVNEYGYLIFQAHPCRDACISVGRGEVDGWEVFNGHFNHNSRNASAKDICTKNEGIPMSGSDAHYFCDIGNGGIIFEEKPQNIPQAIKSGNYTLIESEPQWISFVVANKKTNTALIEKTLKQTQADGVIYYGDGFEIKDNNGKKIEFEENVAVMKRCFIAQEVEALLNIPKNEQRILLTEKITDEIKEKISGKGVVSVIAEKGDDVAPYKEQYTVYTSADMVSFCDGMFFLDFRGPATHINNLQ